MRLARLPAQASGTFRIEEIRGLSEVLTVGM